MQCLFFLKIVALLSSVSVIPILLHEHKVYAYMLLARKGYGTGTPGWLS